MQTAKCFEVYAANGTLIFRVYLSERELPTDDRKPEPVTEQSGSPEKDKGKADGEPMTSAQKRFLFRIMATQGIEGEKAHDELKKRFQVRTLKDIKKLEASKMIEHLLAEGKGGNGDGPSF